MQVSAKNHCKSGFTLVEIAIVLVIIGLLVGGVLAGQSLIHGAQLRRVSTNLNRYSAAINAFRDKYQAIPGDMNNATQFWGVRPGNGNNGTGNDIKCQESVNQTTGTCNGDGNGQIDTVTIGGVWDASLGERFAAWQHLAYAGLIEGSYTGASAQWNAYESQAGINVPTDGSSGTVYELFYLKSYGPTDPQAFAVNYESNVISTLNFVTKSGTMIPEDAWNVDTKFDDGKPGTGGVFTLKKSSTWSPNCATTDDPTTAAYDVGNRTALCIMDMKVR